MNPIQKARHEYQIPNAWWPIPLIDALQQIDIGLCVPWVASCIIDFLSAQPHEFSTLVSDRVRHAVLTTSIQEIESMLVEYDTLLHPVRDNLLLSYRHLIQAKHCLLCGHLIGLRTQIAWALILLGDCAYSHRTNIQFVIDRFSQLAPALPDNQS
jgi:hypothetical protein